jgi:hypothetical protein
MKAQVLRVRGRPRLPIGRVEGAPGDGGQSLPRAIAEVGHRASHRSAGKRGPRSRLPMSPSLRQKRASSTSDRLAPGPQERRRDRHRRAGKQRPDRSPRRPPVRCRLYGRTLGSGRHHTARRPRRRAIGRQVVTTPAIGLAPNCPDPAEISPIYFENSGIMAETQNFRGGAR